MDWILNQTVEQTPLGVTIGKESLTDLHYADDVSLLAEVLVLQDVAAPRRPPDKLDKDKDSASRGTTYDPVDGPSGSRECWLGGRVHLPRVADFTRRRKWDIGIARECFCPIEKNIWKSHIYTNTSTGPTSSKFCETWTVTKTLAKRLDAFDTRHTTNETVRSTVKCSRLKFFGHLARSAQEEDHHHVVSAALWPPSDCKSKHCSTVVALCTVSPTLCIHCAPASPWGVQEPPGWEQSTMPFSPRTLESTRHGGRQGTRRSDNKSSVW